MDREDIVQVVAELFVDLDAHISFCIEAMKRRAGDLELGLRSGDQIPGSCMRVTPLAQALKLSKQIAKFFLWNLLLSRREGRNRGR